MRKGSCLKYRNYSFTKHSFNKNTGKLRWKCATGRIVRCSAAVYTFNNEIVRYRDSHNH